MGHAHRSRPMVLAALCMTAVVSTSACAPARVLTPDKMREKFGTIGVVADRAEAIPSSFKQPVTSRREAIEASSNRFFQHMGDEARRNPVYTILLLPILPIALIIGGITSAIHGAVAAESPDTIEAGAAALHRAVKALDMSGELRDRVITQLAKRGLYHDAVAHDPSLGDPPDTIRTLIRASVTSVQLTGYGINPGLTLSIEATMSTFERGVENPWQTLDPLGVRHLSSSSDGPKFLRWAANDALVFKRRVAGELDDLAEKIVDELLKEPQR